MTKQILTKETIEQYWAGESDYYTALYPYKIDDFMGLWAKEEGLSLPEGFGISSYNSEFFKKINGQKHTANGILKTFGYEHIETEALPLNFEAAVFRAKQLFAENGNQGVLRANKMAAGGGTFILKDESEIEPAIDFILNQKGQLTLFSKYYEAAEEYGVFVVNGKIELTIVKHKNPETGLHNLSRGAKATVLENDDKLSEIKNLCNGLDDLFRFNFARIDVMNTDEGLKIVELSVANFKRLACQDESSYQIAKKLFVSYFNANVMSK